jgi:hypothetical protein
MGTKTFIAFILALAGCAALITAPPVLHAEYSTIKQVDVQAPKSTGTIAASGTYALPVFQPFKDASSAGLTKTINQSAAIQGTGTSPNFKVEVLCSFDGITFVKPDVGGDLGTFTDENLHIVPISTPLSPGGHRLKVNELGGANSIVVVAQEASQ